MKRESHLDEPDFAALLADRPPARGEEAAHLHLLGCRVCQARLFAFDNVEAGLLVDRWYGPGAARAWRRSLERAALESPPFDWAAAWNADQALEVWPPATWPFRMDNDDRFRSGDALVFLLERARHWWQDVPLKAERVSAGIVRILERADWCPETLRVDLLVRAWAYRANALRILDRFNEAHRGFRAANRWFARSSGEATLAGELLWLEGALHAGERNFDVAIRALDKAVELLPPSSGSTTQLDASITLANALGEVGQLEASVATLERLVDNHSPTNFPQGTYLATLQNLAMGYAQLGRPAEAKAYLPEIWRLARQAGKFLNLVRVKWLEAEIYKAESRIRETCRLLAASRFREVQADFLTVGHHVDAALAGLSLAEMYLELEDSAAAADLADELIPIFQSKGIHREATAAGLIVLEALRRETATLGQIQELVERLRRLRGQQGSPLQISSLPLE